MTSICFVMLCFEPKINPPPRNKISDLIFFFFLTYTLSYTVLVSIRVLSHRSPVQNLYWANTKQSESNNNSLLFLHSTPTRRLDAIRIMKRRTYLFCCQGSSTFEDEYLSAVSSDPLRGGKQIPAIYLIPPEIMSQQAQGTQSFIGAHRQHRQENK